MRLFVLLSLIFLAHHGVAETSATQYLMTTSTSSNVTELHLINTADSSQSFTGTLYNSDGEQLGDANLSLGSEVASQGRLILTSTDLEGIFGVAPWVGPAILDVNGDTSFKLMSRLRSPSGLVSNTNCVTEDRVFNIDGFDSENETFIRLINDSNDAIGEIRGTLYDTDGNVIGNADVVLLSSLGAKAAAWISRSALAEIIDAEWQGEAMLEVDDVSGLKLLNLNFVNGETFFNFSCAGNNNSQFVYLQTNPTGINTSNTHIINTSDSSQSYTARLYIGTGDQQGVETALHTLPVAPRGRVILNSSEIQSLFGVDPWSGPALLEINNNASFSTMTKLTSPSGEISNSNCVSGLVAYNIDSDIDDGRAFIRVLNQGTTASSAIRGTLYDANGDIVGTADQVLIDSLAAKQAIWLTVDTLTELFGSWQGTASLILTDNADAELRVINLNFVNGETFFNFSCFESSNQAPQLANAIEDQQVSVGDDAALEVPASTFTDPDDSASPILSVTGLPDGLSFDASNGTITGTATSAASGTYTVTIIATDAELDTASTTFELSVVSSDWMAGVFAPSSAYVAQCASPREGNFPDVAGTFVDENNWLRSWSNELYLWYDEIIDRDPALYSTPTYFNLLVTNELTETGAQKDNFHFSINTEEWENLSQGITFGYGADIILLAASPPRQAVIINVEPNTPAADAGLVRGMEVTAIDGVDMVFGSDVVTLNNGLFPTTEGEQHTFQVRPAGSNTVSNVVLTATQITSTFVKSVTTLDTPTGSVGYMEFSAFREPAEELLVDAFQQFADANVSDLVLDLRYNPGGLVGLAGEVAYMIAGSNADGQIFIEYEYNDQHEVDPFSGGSLQPFGFPTTTLGYSTTPGIPLPTLDLNRVFVLTTASSCSASELVINTLRGINVEVIQIGTTTCGKPYGFVPTDNCGTTYFTIQIRALNATGFGDYVEGFTPTASPVFQTDLPGCVVVDDYFNQLGDPEEGMLSAALNYRLTGTCPNQSAKPHPNAKPPVYLQRPPAHEALIRDSNF